MAAAHLFCTSAFYTGEDTYAGALRAPRAGSPDFVSVFVFVLIYV